MLRINQHSNSSLATARTLSLAIWIWPLLFSNFPVYAEVWDTAHPFIEAHVGGIKIGSDTVEALTRRFGRPKKIVDETHTKNYVYQTAENGKPVDCIFEIGPDDIVTGVLLGYSQTKDMSVGLMAPIRTSRNIGIGDPDTWLIKQYGKPKTKSFKKGKIYKYSLSPEIDPAFDEYYDAEITVRNRKIIKIYIHRGE